MSAVKDIDMTQRKYGVDKTPGGRPRYLFRFGVHEERYCLFKYNANRPVTEPPQAIVICFTLKDFVKTAAEMGLKLTKAEQQELGES